MIQVPRMGWQQRADCTTTPSEPRMLIAPPAGLTTSGRPDSVPAPRRAARDDDRQALAGVGRKTLLLVAHAAVGKRSQAKLEICQGEPVRAAAPG